MTLPVPTTTVAEPRDRGTVAVTPALLRSWPLPSPAGDKEAKGRLLVIGGSDRTPGAVRLAAEAALRPDNRAVLVYEPIEPADEAEGTDEPEGADK